jgi:anti-sigma factor RsiW
MTNHLSPTLLSALADDELSPEQLAEANEHLATCPACTTSALSASLLKSATAKVGHRYIPPPQLQDRVTALASWNRVKPETTAFTTRTAMMGWLTAAMLLFVFTGLFWMQSRAHVSTERAALSTEVFDQHISSLVSALPPQVISTDRHTVKPWFQGKLPFSFNLPETLPRNTTLDGGNLVYLDGRPVAQLLYSIGKHHVSVFLREKEGARQAGPSERSGFHVRAVSTNELDIAAISDVDPMSLAELLLAIQRVQ